MAEKKFLDYAGLQTYDELIKGVITTGDSTTLQSAKDYSDSLADNYDPAGTAQTKADEVKAIIGNTEDLDTTAKTDIVSAINEVLDVVDAGGAGSVVTIDTSVTTEGYAKSYTIKQGGASVGTIDIPKDMVVSSGTVEKDPADQAPGTYLVLTLANATSDKIYINVGTLVDIYTAKASATQVQLAINSVTREISATIVAGGVGTTELADNAVTTIKIADANVTKAKLATAVQTSLDKADSAVQAADVTTGSANGTIAVKGADVAVKGLGSAAYTESTAYDAAGTAQTKVDALANGQVATNTSDIAELQEQVETLGATTYVEITEEEIQALFDSEG